MTQISVVLDKHERRKEFHISDFLSSSSRRPRIIIKLLENRETTFTPHLAQTLSSMVRSLNDARHERRRQQQHFWGGTER